MASTKSLGWSNGVEAQFATKLTDRSVGTSSSLSGTFTVRVSTPMYSLSLGQHIL